MREEPHKVEYIYGRRVTDTSIPPGLSSIFDSRSHQASCSTLGTPITATLTSFNSLTTALPLFQAARILVLASGLCQGSLQILLCYVSY